jgi:aspartyl/asparaginyl beta-hydroxylase (cupin superfamily)
MTGMAALREGRFHEARGIFEALIAGGANDPALLIALAIACRGDGLAERARQIVDQVISEDPQLVRAWILRGDLWADAGEVRYAVNAYQTALRMSADAADVPAEIAAELSRIEAYCRQVSREVEQILERELNRDGPDSNIRSAGARFAESLDLLFDRKKLYLQAPKYYYFPGLAHTQFFERSAFPFLDQVEAATDAIRSELHGVMRDEGAFQPYVTHDPRNPENDQQGMAGNPDWSAFYLWKDGAPVARNLERCPETAKAMEKIPLCDLPSRTPSVLFSRLRPGAHIPPHHGMVNTRLICHLPLIVPSGCRLRVGNETREWVEGKAWVFDDSIEHEAWNDSTETRVILLFEIWRPELSEAEKAAIRALFSAIAKHAPKSGAWEM